jgi:excinuclease ABC subunit C
MRDEAHRFAHGFNRKRRQKKTLESELSEIRGVGPARRKALLKHFGSVRAVRAASAAEIAAVPGVSPGLAQAVAAHLRGGDT